MEGQDNTQKLFPTDDTAVANTDNHEQFHHMLSSDSLDNDALPSVNGSLIGVNDGTSVHQWRLFGQTIPKNEAIFICQVVILYIIIITCIVNLSISNGDSNLWTALLSSSLGIMLPAPTLSRRRH